MLTGYSGGAPIYFRIRKSYNLRGSYNPVLDKRREFLTSREGVGVLNGGDIVEI